MLNFIKQLFSKKKSKVHTHSPRMMLGAGVCHCKDCDYRDNITFSTHGFDSGKRNKDGSLKRVSTHTEQCQGCGKFHKYHSRDKNTSKVCDCGGAITWEDEMFCPKCKSKEVYFDAQFIT